MGQIAHNQTTDYLWDIIKANDLVSKEEPGVKLLWMSRNILYSMDRKLIFSQKMFVI